MYSSLSQPFTITYYYSQFPVVCQTILYALFSPVVSGRKYTIWPNCTNHILCLLFSFFLFCSISCCFLLVIAIPSTIFLHSNSVSAIVFLFCLCYIWFIEQKHYSLQTANPRRTGGTLLQRTVPLLNLISYPVSRKILSLGFYITSGIPSRFL